MRVQTKLAGFIIAIILAAVLSNANITGDGGRGSNYKDFHPEDGERAYQIQIGAASTFNLAHLQVTLNGRRETFDLTGGITGAGVFVRGFPAKKGTTIALKVERTGPKRSEKRFGTISNYITEDHDEVCGDKSDDPYEEVIVCVWIVGSEHPV
ncbi:MAG: hypothetical protein EHM35_02515 [Planctomycetaceae bacterium]|nr:MAG: hypothetical protein EHM35_02515 [Planctomycetaceae bacterium]